MNSTLVCNLPSYNKTYKNVDELGCSILNFAATLFYYDFGYYCMGPVFLVIVISIFGNIKANYRWFILYKAFWDLSNCSYYSCGNIMAQWVKKPPECFYLIRVNENYIFPSKVCRKMPKIMNENHQ